MTALRVLRIAAAAEAVSIAVLLANLLTVHAEAVTSAAGPLHGLAYVTVVAAASTARAATGVRRRALLPGVGGLLALRRLRSRPSSRTDRKDI
ncbi:DUF3817 domain-containing protein [Planobispora longispora]|uniref:DUF3817 domain-containing protein n=1 Tax=Planobispora longispora TaxID=28887 RepID=A0A8J3RJU9_9ACTN|nr:DUF3817 domain-containing protein [Planobispora longispora]GIH73633.1 hypothetical protein Plo01_00620 [Planobispora longispora]